MDAFQLQLFAREAGFTVQRSPALPQPWITGMHVTDSNIAGQLERFAELVAAAERQACIHACQCVLAYDVADPAAAFVDAIHSRTAPARPAA